MPPEEFKEEENKQAFVNQSLSIVEGGGSVDLNGLRVSQSQDNSQFQSILQSSQMLDGSSQENMLRISSLDITVYAYLKEELTLNPESNEVRLFYYKNTIGQRLAQKLRKFGIVCEENGPDASDDSI